MPSIISVHKRLTDRMFWLTFLYVALLFIAGCHTARAQDLTVPDIGAEAADDPAPEVVSTVSTAFAGLIDKVTDGADPYVQFSIRGAMSSLVIIALLTWLRKMWPEALAPEPSTKRSQALNMRIALVAGLTLGAIGIAPSIGSSAIWYVALIERILGGFLCATVAVFGRDFWNREQGAFQEKRVEKAAIRANMTTSQMKALRAEAQAEESTRNAIIETEAAEDATTAADKAAGDPS